MARTPLEWQLFCRNNRVCQRGEYTGIYSQTEELPNVREVSALAKNASKKNRNNDPAGVVTLQRAFKVRMYPDEKAAEFFQQCFGCCRFIWNKMLSDEQEFYCATDEHFIPTPAKYKRDFPFLKQVDSLALANTQLRLQKAFSDFFASNANHPKFKSKKRTKKSYTTNCQFSKKGVPSIELEVDRIKLPKVGWVSIRLHRKPRAYWKLKSATISQNSVGAYYCSLLFEWTEKTPAVTMPTLENTIGLDYSSPLFYVDDKGRSPDKQRFFRASEERLAREQRRLSKMQYGSKNYWAQKKRIDKIHEKIANQRRDFCHQESRKIANSYVAVCVEDINLRALSKSLKLGKSTMDNGFGMFRNFLRYKLEERGKHYIVIDKWFPSSKTCSCCGYINKELVVGVSEWLCPECGLVVQRDYNAAINIKEEGLRQFYEEFCVAA